VSLKLPSSPRTEYIEFVATILTTVAVLQYLGVDPFYSSDMLVRPKQLVAEVEGLFGRLPVELSERYEHPDEKRAPTTGASVRRRRYTAVRTAATNDV